MITTIFFDLDDTLLWDKKSVKKAFEATCEIAKEQYEVDSEKLEEAVRSAARELYASYPTYPFTKMIGINPFEGLWGNFDDPGEDFQQMHKIVPTYRKDAWIQGLQTCGIDDATLGEQLAEQFIIEREKHPFVYEDTFSVLEQVKEEYQLLLLTNGSPSLQKKKLLITPEIKSYFDHIIISGSFGRGKPDPSIFDYAVEQAQVEKKEVIMVGDNLMTDILGSNRAGIKNIWINHHGQLIEDVSPTYEVKTLTEALDVIKSVNAN
ncbi:putative hydrolase of the HAD superfamily [Natronobacillus azotifigens]|uniref:Phosphoserine phosphatase n=1 Tax=Natronobacillus azotifigens TaxID=472978 RepID=A0A9J6RA90_9BACI|nr:HAD family hydrolase [Natronobacillus azotifigens]MCZ0702235.1 HAD family hydrolase [Natronobacillus azotifigens]